ncbi:monocarboxylate transporter 10-like [Stylophora pistillata]|uniref:Monocarboxylate transporter 10 n=1 Tax=Stylophora pistillata TaxID=50429 RepID=A0A2B4S067_STYPI|nr:monocarboxylate transporter 10-like [Stylophora pistillata]XP_022796499.1 monocarboxylate transporter 10-like [Stylophora pistillata]XP_022796500.1 monocarboxylate transporter 10-like [Stylophora pistillata]XP_022796501.1 monocarboxylate transporter 10-like [Stylophora pistillata]XP_022796502.1 monocarboxylate transporter 10-like [Stylophora pistillata]PFX21885.1 Monocarboxylate transporter 10 [Stylophora pistillata]
MFSIYNCCVKARHQQDSKWSFVVCVCAIVTQVMVLGIMRSFGVLFPVLMAEFETSREKTAWIGSLCISLALFAAPFVGRLSEKFSCRCLIMTGALLFVTGLMATSFINNIAIMFITYSILTGLGACFCRTSCFLIAAKYFNKRRSFATGMITMGSSLGLFVWGPITQVLLDSFGWRNTFRVMAATCTLIFLCAMTFNPNVEEKDSVPEGAAEKQNIGESDDNDVENDDNNVENDDCSKDFEAREEKMKILDFSIWRMPQYCILVSSFSLMYLSRFIPVVHLAKYSEELNISADQASFLYMFLGISGGMSAFLIGRLCDVKWINIRYVNRLGILGCGIATLLLPLAKNYISVAFYSVVFGFADGSFITTQNVILLNIVGPKRRAAAFGFGCMLCSLALAAGPPLAGFIADQLASYKFAFYTAGSLNLLSAAIQMLLVCFEPPVKESDGESNTALTIKVVTVSEKVCKERQHEKADHKELLGGLYVKSLLKKSSSISASVESIQFL